MQLLLYQVLTCLIIFFCSVQVFWNSLSRTYWVHWHMVEILGSGSGGSQTEKETQEKASSLTETLKLTTGKSWRLFALLCFWF